MSVHVHAHTQRKRERHGDSSLLFCFHSLSSPTSPPHPLLPSSGKLLVVVTDAGLYQRAEGGPRAEGPISITASTSTAQLKGSDGAATADLHPAKYTSESTEIRA